MNPLPRFLGLSLFVVLTVLTALLAVPFLTQSNADATPQREPAAPVVAAADHPPHTTRLAALPMRVRNSPSSNTRATHPRGARGRVVASDARISTRAQLRLPPPR